MIEVNFDIVKYLLSKGADVNKKKYIWRRHLQ